MSTQRIGHGQTFALTGTLAASSTLVGLSGDPGALIEVSGTAKNKGVITLKGAAAAHKQGATLSDAGVLTNTGAIDVDGGMNSSHAALLLVAGTLSNSGTLVGQAGSDGAGGQILVGGSGVLRNSGTLTLAAGVAAGSLGATLADTGVVVNRADGVIDVLAASAPINSAAHAYGTGGVITVSGTFTNQGSLVLYDSYRSGGYKQSTPEAAATMSISGLLQNSGSVLVGADPHFYPTAGALLTVSGRLDNTGTVNVSGSPSEFIFAPRLSSLVESPVPIPGSTLVVTGVLDNQGQIDVQGGGPGGHYLDGGYGALLTDLGTVDNSGTLTIGGLYAADGYPKYLSGSGADVLVGGVLINTGVIAEHQDSALTIDGSLTNYGSLTAHGGRGYAYIDRYFGVGGLIAVSGSLTNAATGVVTLFGGISALPYYPFNTPIDGYGAALSVTGRMTNDGSIIVGGGSGGVPSGRGDYAIGLGAELSVAAGGLLDNAGTIEIRHGATSSYGVYGTGGVLTVAGSLDDAYGVITVDGGAGASAGEVLITSTGYIGLGTIDGSGVLVNQGILLCGFSSLSTTTFVNDGTVKLAYFDASTVIASAIGADPGKTGVLSLYNRDTLTLKAAVASSQSVSFHGGLDDLRLAPAATFAGTLSGLAATDMIDFLKQDITSAVANGDTLTLGMAGGGSFGLALAAPLSGISLTLQSDQHGGTELLFSVAGAGG